MVRHFLLTVGVPGAARELLGRLVSGDETDAPQITTAKDWHVGFEPGPGDNPADLPRRKPDYCLNLGITWPGLIALEIKDRVPAFSFKSFGAFVVGAAARAELVGDTGPSGPGNWIGNPRGQPVTGQGQPGGSNNTHRLIRRGMPYGPVYDQRNLTTAQSAGSSVISSTRTLRTSTSLC